MYLPTLLVFQGVSKFFINSPGLPVRAPNLLGTIYHGFLKLFFIYFIILDISKRKIIQEGDLLLLFELSSIGKCKQSNQIDVYLTSLLIGQKPTNQIAQYLMENWHDSRMLFTSVEAKMASMDFVGIHKVHCTARIVLHFLWVHTSS